MHTRRQFIAGCSAVAVTASVVPMAFARPSPERMLPLDHIRVGDFARQLNTSFSVSLANGTTQEIRLMEIRPLDAPNGRRPRAAELPNEKFALLFRGPAAAPLVQETRQFTHPRIGCFVMFMVPIGCNDRSHCYYEVIFNRPPREAKAGRPGG